MSDLSWMRPKLAELCGLRFIDEAGVIIIHPRVCCGCDYGCEFRPDEDVAQAVRCLEALKWDCGVTYRTDIVGVPSPFWDCWIDKPTEDGGGDVICHTGPTFAAAACLAIAAALGWTEEAAERGTP